MASFKMVRYPVFTPIGGPQPVYRQRTRTGMAFLIFILNMNLLLIGMRMDSTMKASGIMILMVMVFMIIHHMNRIEMRRGSL